MAELTLKIRVRADQKAKRMRGFGPVRGFGLTMLASPCLLALLLVIHENFFWNPFEQAVDPMFMSEVEGFHIKEPFNFAMYLVLLPVFVGGVWQRRRFLGLVALVMSSVIGSYLWADYSVDDNF